MFVSYFHNGSIYRFNLTDDRKTLEISSLLEDKVADGPDELKSNLFGRDFGRIADMEVALMVISVFFRISGNECIHNIYGGSILYNSPELGTVPDTAIDKLIRWLTVVIKS